MRRFLVLIGIVGLACVLIGGLGGFAMFWFRREEQPAFVWKFTNIRSALFLRNDLLAVADDRQTTFRRFPDNQVLQTLPVGGYLALHPDRTLLAIGSWGTVWLYDPVSGERRATFNCWPRGEHISPMSLTFSPDGSILAVSEANHSQDLEVQLWDVMNQRQIGSILLADPDATFVAALAFSPDGEHLVVGTNASVWLVDVAQRTVSRQIQPRPSGSIAFSPDGSRLVLGGKFIRVYDTATWQLAYEITFPEVLKDHITPEKLYIFSMNVAISPDGRWLATPNQKPPHDSISFFEPGPPRQTIALRNPADGRRKRILSGSPISLGTLMFSPDGKWLLNVGLSDVRVWRVEN